MMRLALLAAVAVVAGAHDATAAVAAAKAAMGEVSWAEARCMLYAGADGAAQVRLVVEKLQRVLSELGLKFDDVVVLWNRCAHLDEIEEAVLMTRSRDFGLTRPLAEAVLEVVETDPNPAGAALEYIVVAKLPRALAEVRALA